MTFIGRFWVTAEDFIFTRDDGEPVKDFRGAWWKACVAAGVGKFACKQCGETVTVMGKRIHGPTVP